MLQLVEKLQIESKTVSKVSKFGACERKKGAFFATTILSAEIFFLALVFYLNV